MNHFQLIWTALLVLAVGCATCPPDVASLSEPTSSPAAALSTGAITPVAYQAPAEPEPLEPPTTVVAPVDQPASVAPQPLPSATGLDLATLEQMAFGNNPAIAQSEARVRALQGKWVQVGLPPNPTAGYVGSEMGNDGAGGQQGGFVGQNFITAQKLQRNRAVVAAEVNRAEQELAAVRRRVSTDVSRGYYNALLAQRRVELADQLVRLNSEAAKSSKALYDAEEIPLAGLLQTEVRQQNALVFARTAQNSLDQAWRQLSAVVGGPGLPIQPLVGDVKQLPVALDWQEQLDRIQRESPELAAAFADVQRARRALDRACVEAVPNISTQTSVQYDDGSNYTIAGVQVGVALPLWNRNQGGIRQAQAEVAEAVRNVDRVGQNLNQKLADAYREYADSQVTAVSYANEILPRSQRTFELVQKGYAQGEVGYLDLLTAQQTYSQTNLAYLEALSSLWQSYTLIDGLLLEGSLERESR